MCDISKYTIYISQNTLYVSHYPLDVSQYTAYISPNTLYVSQHKLDIYLNIPF